MNMFASETRDPVKGSTWIAEIQSGIDQVTNPKAAAALSDARKDIAALLEIMTAEEKVPRGRSH